MVSPQNTVPSPILSGWKDIARYLGKGIRTVQRYELELGLPIRRPPGKWRASVIATTAELDAWVKAGSLRRSFALRRGVPENVAGDLERFRTALAFVDS